MDDFLNFIRFNLYELIAPEFPPNEAKRQHAVEKYQLLDTLAEERYDDITALMAHICEAPISLISLLDRDRNFLKSHHGIPFNESPRELSFCGHAINSDEPITIIEDARIDERFHDNPIVAEHNAIFYAGVPLVDPDGFKLGTLCVYDSKPRQLDDFQKKTLESMAKQVVKLFEERYQNFQLQRLKEKLERKNENLEKFAGVVSHDLKSPLAQISMLTDLLEEGITNNSITDEVLEYLGHIKSSSDALRVYIDGILKHYRSDSLIKTEKEIIQVKPFFDELLRLLGAGLDEGISLNSSLNTILANKTVLSQILLNLISNALKYNDKKTPIIELGIEESDSHYLLKVSDNGPGIPEKNWKEIFNLFTTMDKTDRNGNKGTGIGLATVKKLIEDSGGKISVESTIGEGSTFTFSISKI